MFQVTELFVDNDERIATPIASYKAHSLRAALNLWQEMVTAYNEVEATEGDAVWYDREIPMPGFEYYAKAFIAGCLGVTRLPRDRRCGAITIALS